MFKKMDVPGDRTPKAQNDGNKSKGIEADNTNDNVKADNDSADEPTPSSDPSPTEKK